jgi:redox-sensing transcriptional repressor
MSQRQPIPRPTVKRLSLYLRELEVRQEAGSSTVSSRTLGETLGITDAQVRRDLGHFGQFGQPGIGYSVEGLIPELKSILKIDRGWNAAVIGVGNIGRALLHYPRFGPKGFHIVAAFDIDDSILGTTINGCQVHAMDELESCVKSQEIRMGILSVPLSVAQDVADMMVTAGIRGILNFTPIRIDVGGGVDVVSVDFSRALEQLAYQVSAAEGRAH